MAKVDWITWKTETNEIIDSEKVNNTLNKSVTDMNSILDTVYNNVKTEVDKGGLDTESLNLNGESPSNVVANKVLKNIEDIRAIVNRLNNKVNNQVLEQKKIEKEQLISSIEEKIKEQENILSNTEALRDRITPDNNMVNANEVNNVINNTREKIKMLYERLEKAKAI